MGRAAILIAAVVTAGMMAMLTGSVAHDGFGIPLDASRVDALSGAGVIFRGGRVWFARWSHEREVKK